MTDLLTAVRNAVGDKATATQSQRFEDDEIFAAIDFSLAEMWATLQAGNIAGRLQSHTLTYEGESEPMPSGVEANAIYKVEDYSDAAAPMLLNYVGYEDVGRVRARPCWSLLNNSIYVYPEPETSITLRIWTAAAFPRTADAAGTDTHILPINHEELIILGAAIRLQEVDDEVAPGRLARKAELMKLFQEAAPRIKARKYVGNVRHFR